MSVVLCPFTPAENLLLGLPKLPLQDCTFLNNIVFKGTQKVKTRSD